MNRMKDPMPMPYFDMDGLLRSLAPVTPPANPLTEADEVPGGEDMAQPINQENEE